MDFVLWSIMDLLHVSCSHSFFHSLYLYISVSTHTNSTLLLCLTLIKNFGEKKLSWVEQIHKIKMLRAFGNQIKYIWFIIVLHESNKVYMIHHCTPCQFSLCRSISLPYSLACSRWETIKMAARLKVRTRDRLWCRKTFSCLVFAPSLPFS